MNISNVTRVIGDGVVTLQKCYFANVISESLLTSLFTFFFISIRILRREGTVLNTNCHFQSRKSVVNLVIYASFSIFHAIFKKIYAIKNCKIVGWQKG